MTDPKSDHEAAVNDREKAATEERPSPERDQSEPLGGAYVPQIRPAMEDVCCGSGCSGCPTYWGE